MPCQCRLKSGPRVGQPCGRATKHGSAFCAKHVGCATAPSLHSQSFEIVPKYKTAQLADDRAEYTRHESHLVHQTADLVIKRLGQGAFGAVDLVNHYEFGLCARKNIKNNVHAHQELNIFKYLHGCPWNIQLFGFVERPASITLYMEYFDGVELNDADINMHTSDGLRRWLFYTHELIKAVKCLHSVGVVHRDIKPANIMVNRDSLKLIDFGMSCLFAKCTLNAKGSPNFFAPEMFRLERSTMEATDIWALASTMYNIASGRKFYGEASTIDELKVRMSKIRTLSDVEAVLDQRLTTPATAGPTVKKILLPLLEPNPQQRIENFKKLIVS